jgi:hypothetical protein
VRYAACGTQVDKTVQTRDSNCNFNAVCVETQKSDEVLAEQVQKAPRQAQMAIHPARKAERI